MELINLDLDLIILISLSVLIVGLFMYFKIKKFLTLFKEELLSDQTKMIESLKKDIDMNSKMTFAILEHEATGNHVNNMVELAQEYRDYIINK